MKETYKSRRQISYKYTHLLKCAFLNIKKVLQNLNQLPEFIQCVAEISHGFVPDHLLSTKKKSLYSSLSWVVLDVLEESHTESAVSSNTYLSHFVTLIQHMFHAYVFVELRLVFSIL